MPNQEIVELHKKQVNSYNGKSFTVYRGQGLSIIDFEKLRKNKGGLISFNNFLSTSKDRNVSMAFAESASSNSDTNGILFEMTIDPSISSAPFASIQEVSRFSEEEEILFSMHTVFRIGEINTIDNNDSLYQVNLTLTADDDQQLRTLTEYIREEIGHGTGWSRLGQLLLKLEHCDKAEQLYNALLEQTTVNHEQALYYHQLGCIKGVQSNYTKAIEYYEKAIQIRENTPSLNHQYLAISYNNIGSVYDKMGEYLQALSFHEKALELRQNILSSNHSDLAQTYSNMGVVYVHMGEHLKALSYYEKALKIDQENLPANHPDLTTTYSNIAGIYRIMGEYSKALLYYEKTLEIDQKTLPPESF
jgi:tetratricopeptide (TPR) repeat protein